MKLNDAPSIETRSVPSLSRAPGIVSEPQATATDLFPQEAILFDQIGERLSLYQTGSRAA